MDSRLDAMLCSAFPLLYRGRNAPPSESDMGFGFEVGDGWFGLLWELSGTLEAILERLPEEERPRTVQVKEKYGTLRFYLDSSSDEMEAAIDRAERRSVMECEICGASGGPRGSSWITVLCDFHAIAGV